MEGAEVTGSQEPVRLAVVLRRLPQQAVHVHALVVKVLLLLLLVVRARGRLQGRAGGQGQARQQGVAAGVRLPVNASG